MKKRMISMLLAAMMAVSFSAVSVSAEENSNIPTDSSYSQNDKVENVVATINTQQASSDLLNMISESGLVLNSDDEILIIQQNTFSRSAPVNEIKVVQKDGDVYNVSNLIAFDEDMNQMDIVTVSPVTRAVVNPSVTVTQANLTMTVTATYTKISRSTAPTGLFLRPRSVSMSFTTNTGAKLNSVTLSCQAQGIKCNANFEQSSPYDPEFIIYIESSFSNVPANRTISSSTVKPTNFSGYVQYYGGDGNNVYVTVEGTTSEGKTVGFTRPMLTVED